MAMKPLRNTAFYDDISMYMDQVAERGRVVIWDTTTTGLGGMDDANALCKMPTDSGGNPIGVLTNDVVDIDQSRYALNAHQDEVQKNSKVTILKKGFVVTNVLVAGQSPIPGSGAYFTTSGQFTTSNASVRVGTFASGKDADGYVKVEVNL
jgi:hypothetical protein